MSTLESLLIALILVGLTLKSLFDLAQTWISSLDRMVCYQCLSPNNAWPFLILSITQTILLCPANLFAAICLFIYFIHNLFNLPLILFLKLGLFNKYLYPIFVGSGKSSIVCAMCLLFAGSPSLLGRETKVIILFACYLITISYSITFLCRFVGWFIHPNGKK